MDGKRFEVVEVKAKSLIQDAIKAVNDPVMRQDLEYYFGAIAALRFAFNGQSWMREFLSYRK